MFVIDRGIYGKDVLSRINDNGDTLITWEKGYARDGWSDKLPVCHFKITRYRNNFQDTASCDFNCVRYPSKITGYDRIIVRAKVRQAFQLFLDQAGGNDTTFNGKKIEFRLGQQIKGGIYSCDCPKTFSPSK